MSSRPATDSVWLRRYGDARPGAPRLVCFPHAGGSASFYFPVAQALAPDIDVLAVQYPGRQDRRGEPLIDSVAVLADRIFSELAALVTAEPDVPVYLFGHSMGATVAFEVTRRLQDAALPGPVRLFASARRAPSRTRADRVHTRDDDGLIQELRRLSGTDARVLGNEEIMRMAIPSIRNDYRAVETYRAEPGTRIDTPVSVLVGDNDPTTTLAEARAWEEHTSAGIELRVFPGGGHFYLADRPEEVLDVIRERVLVSAVGAG
ncbi:alpha/beta fold hydrolase [Streptomyces sp. NPDC046876]|uniref:thioesterase II family protein n=1 Tax=Streptomyces sp. NPDC046876 TaxID=3155616 RepID=UPI0033FD6919